MQLLTEEEIDSLLRRTANKIARGDARVLDDVMAIIASLRKDPYGLGTQKLPNKQITVRHNNLPWRRLDPEGRSNLSLRHEQSWRLRVIYVIYPNPRDEKRPVICLEGIYTHEEYETKLRSL